MSFMNLFYKKEWSKQYNKDQPIKHTLIELLFYVIFLIIVSIISYGIAGATMFYMSDIMTKVFIEKLNFQEITSIDEYWQYVDEFIGGYVYDTESNSTNMYFLEENVFLGPPRLKQLKVRNGSCAIDDHFKTLFRNCYGPFKVANQDTGSFGPENGTAWNYHTSNELEDIFLWGQIGTYPGGGFYQDLQTNLAESQTLIDRLKHHSWLDSSSRLVLIEFTVYNANVNMFCVAKLIAEIPATGGILPSYSFKTVKLLRFVDKPDYFILACEIIFFIQVLWYTSVELYQLWKESWRYFTSFWNIIDMAIVLISYMSFGFSIYRYVYINDKLAIYKRNPSTYVNFDFLVFWHTRYNDFMAICVFLVWIKIFKFITFNKTMLQLSTTLSRCTKDLIGFGVMFFIVFIAYAQLGYILFGTEDENFRTYSDSIFTLLRTVLGDFDYLAIERANRILGPIYFVTYIFFVFFVLLNMFLAIINDTYSDVKSEEYAPEIQIGQYLKRKWLSFYKWWTFDRCRSKNRRIVKASGSVEDEIQNSESYDGVVEDTNIRPGRTYGLSEIFEPVNSNSFIDDYSKVIQRVEIIEKTLDAIVVKLDEFIESVNRTETVIIDSIGLVEF